jgi:hypothetical protein
MVQALTHALSHLIHEDPPTIGRVNQVNGTQLEWIFLFHKLYPPGLEPWWEASHLEALTN